MGKKKTHLEKFVLTTSYRGHLERRQDGSFQVQRSDRSRRGRTERRADFAVVVGKQYRAAFQVRVAVSLDNNVYDDGEGKTWCRALDGGCNTNFKRQEVKKTFDPCVISTRFR